MSDWMRYMSPAELQQEAMDHEMNAHYDRYIIDGWGDPDLSIGEDFDRPPERRISLYVFPIIRHCTNPHCTEIPF